MIPLLRTKGVRHSLPHVASTGKKRGQRTQGLTSSSMVKVNPNMMRSAGVSSRWRFGLVQMRPESSHSWYNKSRFTTVNSAHTNCA
eukprot:1522032-Rhodomonas_salina.3